MSALSAQGYCAVCGQRFFFIFWLIFAKAKIKKGIPHPAGCGSGLCPENPQPFEKGWRKLYFACGRESGLAIPLLTVFFHPSCLSGFQGCLDIQHALVRAAAEAKL